MALDCRIVTDFAELESISGEWERFSSGTDSPVRGSVFQSWAWARACWAERESHVSLHAPVVTDSGQVVLIMPLVLDRHMLRWLGFPYSDYNDIVCQSRHPAALTACLQTLIASSGWTTCVLHNVPDCAAMLSMRNKLPMRLQRRLVSVPRFAYSSVREDGSGILDQMSRKRSFRQHENQLRRSGRNLVFRHIEDRSEILSHLNEFFAMHISRSALSGRRSVLASPRAQEFFRRLVETMSPVSDLRFAILELDNRPVAYHFGFQTGGQLICYIPTFHVDYWDRSPGEVLFRNIFKYAHEAGLGDVDLTIGDESYKSRFANFTGKTYTLYVDRNLTSPKTVVCRVIRAAEKYARQEPATLAFARQIVSMGRKSREMFKNFGETLARHLQSSIAASEYRVGLSRAVSTSKDVKVERVSLYSLGLYLARNNITILGSQLQVLRSNFRRNDELYYVSTVESPFFLWKSGEYLCEDPLTLASPTREFGLAIAALLRHTSLQAASLATRRRGARHWLTSAGLWFAKPDDATSGVERMRPQQSDVLGTQPR